MNVPEMKRRASGIQRNRRRIVTVIGSGRSADEHSAEVGRLIATLGVDLLTGGGSGVMEATSRAFFETSPRQGIVIGVLPGKVRSGLFGSSRSAARRTWHMSWRPVIPT